MSWEPEIEELRRRQALAAQMGGRRQGRAPARLRQDDDPRAHRGDGRRRQLPRDRRARRRGPLRRERRTRGVHAGQLPVRHRRHRRPARDALGRRLHRARRLRRTHLPGQAREGGRHRARAAVAARAPRGRHGWRRLGEDHRDGGPHLHPRGAQLGAHCPASRGGTVGRARAGLGGRHRRRARRHLALLADRARHGADDDRRARAGGLGEPRQREQGGARLEPHPHAQRRDRRRGGERGRGLRAHPALPLLPAVVGGRTAAGAGVRGRHRAGAIRASSTSSRATRARSTRCGR